MRFNAITSASKWVGLEMTRYHQVEIDDRTKEMNINFDDQIFRTLPKGDSFKGVSFPSAYDGLVETERSRYNVLVSLTLPTVTAAALLDSVNPCAISVLLLTIGFLFSLRESRRRIFLIAGSYIAGIFVVYVLIGLGVLRALTLFGVPKAISKIGAIILGGTGVVNLLGAIFPSFPVKLVIPSVAKPGIAALMMKSSVPAAFLMGVVVGMFEFPCTGGPYLAILALLHDQATIVQGALYLLYYNLIFIAPLIFLLAATNNAAVTEQLARWRREKGRAFEMVSSVAMILLGLVIFLVSP